jgi:membrane protein YqaA with SNARE-associated domain
VRPLTQWLVAVFASPPGIFALAALDSTLFFSVPLGIDAVVIILAARLQDRSWIVPLLATGGSLAGAGVTFWMGMKAGEQGLERYVPSKRLDHIRQKIKSTGAVALGALSIVPPPFPFTPFVLAAGALEVRPAMFFATLAGCRLVRFGLETWLASKYGRRILQWLDAPVVVYIVIGSIVLALALSTMSIVRLVRSTKPAAASA